nr:uncharacterized protein LOC109745248 [Aegilops tauschii subsp. strangulata]
MHNRILLILWRAWFLHDDIVHGNGKESISGWVGFLLKYEQEVKEAQLRTDSVKATCDMNQYGDQRLTPPVQNAMRWEAPPIGTIKLNTDAAFEAATGRSAGGAVARDHQGRVLFSMGCNIDRCLSVEEAEGIAGLMGLRELAKYFNGPIEVEMDCLVLSRAIAPGVSNLSPLYPIVADMQAILAGYPSCKTRWIRREQNGLAHGLAHRAKLLGDFFQLSYVPDELNDIWSKECRLVW